MAVSGLIMVLYLLAHMYGNLKVFSGQAAFDDYARHLRTIGEPFLPYSGALWIVRVVLLASVLVHVYAAIVLWRGPGPRPPVAAGSATRAVRPVAACSARTRRSRCGGAVSSSRCSWPFTF